MPSLGDINEFPRRWANEVSNKIPTTPEKKTVVVVKQILHLILNVFPIHTAIGLQAFDYF